MDDGSPQAQEESELNSRARILMGMGRYEDALPLLHQNLASDPDDYTTLCQLSEVYARTADFVTAVTWAEKAIASDPDSSWSYASLSWLLTKLGRNQEALEAALEAVERDPDDPDSLMALCRSSVLCGEFDDAREIAKALSEAMPGSAQTYDVMGFMMLHMKRWEEAEGYYRTALSLDPTSPTILCDLSCAIAGQIDRYVVRSSAERFFETLDYLYQAFKLDPLFYQIRRNIAVLLCRYLFESELVWVCRISVLYVCLSLPLWKLWHKYIPVYNCWLGIGEILLVSLFVIQVWRRKRFLKLPPYLQAWWKDRFNLFPKRRDR